MSDIADRVWRSYHLSTVQVDHPLRLLCDEARRLESELEQMRELAQANGQQRDAYCRAYLDACRERDRLRTPYVCNRATLDIDQRIDQFAADVREIGRLVDAGPAAQAREHDGPGGLLRFPHDDMGTPTEDAELGRKG